MLKRLLLRVGLAGFGLGLALLALEIFVRLFLPQPLSAVKRHPILGWLDKPGARYVYTRQEFSVPIQINSQGFRDVEHSLEKPPGVFRIAVVGDSFPEGQQVPLEQTFPKIIEAELRKKNPKIEVLNCGISGFGADQYLLLIQEKILSYSPDIVIVLFTPGDISDTMRKDIAWLENGKLRLRQSSDLSFKTRLASELKSFLRQRSMLWILFTDRLDDFRLGERFLDWSWRAVGDPRMRRKDADLTGLAYYLKNPLPRILEGWKLVGEILKEIHRILLARRVKFLLVCGTARMELNPLPPSELLEAHRVSAEDVDTAQIHHVLSRIARENRLPYLDLLPAFRRLHAKGAILHWRMDGHWTPRGHSSAAREILGEIRRRGFLPRETP